MRVALLPQLLYETQGFVLNVSENKRRKKTFMKIYELYKHSRKTNKQEKLVKLVKGNI